MTEHINMEYENLSRIISLLIEYNDKIKQSIESGAESGELAYPKFFPRLYPDSNISMLDELRESADQIINSYRNSEYKSLIAEARLRLSEFKQSLGLIVNNYDDYDIGYYVYMLNKYTTMLTDIGDSIDRAKMDSQSSVFSVVSVDKYENIVRSFRRMQPPMLDLARSVSQMIEHLKMPDHMRIDLRIRLANFEGLLESVGGKL